MGLTIFVIARWYTAQFDHPTAIRDGTEMVIKKGLKHQLEAGHIIHMTHAGEVCEFWQNFHPNLHFHQVLDTTYDFYTEKALSAETKEEAQRWKTAKASAGRASNKRVEQLVRQIQPDVVFNHLTSTHCGNYADEFPMVTMLHLGIKDLLAAPGQLKRMGRINKSGGVVYSAPKTLDYSRGMIEDMPSRATRQVEKDDLNEALANNLWVNQISKAYTPLDDELFSEGVKPANGEILQIGRIDEKDQKRFRLVSTLGQNVVGYGVTTKGGKQRLLEKLEAAPNVELNLNRPRAELVNRLRTASAVVMAWPDEPSGIAVIEGLVNGALPIMFTRNQEKFGAYHGGEPYIPEGIEYPKPIWIESPTIKEDFAEAVEFCRNVPFETRQMIAAKSRAQYCNEAWLKEWEGLCYRAIANHQKSAKIPHSLDLF